MSSVQLSRHQITSVDPRLLKKGATVLRVAAALTHPVGRFISYSAVSVGGLTLVYLASLSMTGKGYKVRFLILLQCSRKLDLVRRIPRSSRRHNIIGSSFYTLVIGPSDDKPQCRWRPLRTSW